MNPFKVGRIKACVFDGGPHFMMGRELQERADIASR